PATDADIDGIQGLYREVYDGKYPQEFANDRNRLALELADRAAFLWIVAEDAATGRIAGAIQYRFDARHRRGKAAGVAVLPAYRSKGIGAGLLTLGIEKLTRELGVADVVYATTRTVNEAPSRAVAEAGYRPLGVFPNAVQVETFEHLSLDVYLTE